MLVRIGCLSFLALALSLPAPESVEVTFPGHGEVELAGTLLVPEDVPEGGAPALLLIAGSGPTDRNGNQAPILVTNLLQTLAERATAAGFVTLRYDKRATSAHHAHLLSLSLGEQNAFLSWEAFVGDVKEGFAWLAAHEATDPERVAILGHSEGGLYALQAAADLGEAGPAGLVLAATCGTPLGDVLRVQIDNQLRAVPDEQAQPLREALDEAIELVIAEQRVPDDLPPGLRALFPANALELLQIELAADPRLLAPSFPGPVLVLAAEHDVQVPPEPHVEELRGALDERKSGSCEVFVVPGASHNFKSVSSPNEPGFAGDVVPETLTTLERWLRDHVRN